MPRYIFRWSHQIAEIDRRAWNALAQPLATPFLEWDWLHLLEASGSAAGQAGWLPCHLSVWSGRRLVAAAPMYIKAHSLGEFVYDHVWAELSRRLGRAYYPKLVGMSPFTPMIGYRFLVAPDRNEDRLTEQMLAQINDFCRRHHLSGCSFHFVDPDWGKKLQRGGYTCWQHQSFRWDNPGFHSFEDYLALFKANQRRNIRRERRAMENQGLHLSVKSGEEISSDWIPLMYRYYQRTNDKFGPWGCRYLTAAFFDGLQQVFGHRLVLVAATDGGRNRVPVALSLLVTKAEHLYGRYWGCAREIKHLHFNACYYRPIEWAIARGVKHFDPGAGGYHKVRRGFSAVSNYSLHRFLDRRLQTIVERHIEEINRLEQEQIDELNRRIPFASNRKTAPPPAG